MNNNSPYFSLFYSQVRMNDIEWEIRQIDLAIADGDFSLETVDLMSENLDKLRNEFNRS